MSDKPAKRALVDWEAVERDYRADLLSLREIGVKHGCTEGAIRKRKKKDEEGGRQWERDLGAKIKAKADDLVRKDAVRSEVRSTQAASEREVVDANAQAIVNVRLGHRKDIAQGRALTIKLLDELEHHTDNRELLAQLGEIMADPDEKTGRDRLNEIYRAVISLPERTKTMKALSDSLKTLIGLEREAFNIGSEAEKAPELENLSDEELDAKIEASLGRIKPTRAS